MTCKAASHEIKTLVDDCIGRKLDQAVATASKTVRNIVSVEVVKSTAVVSDGEIVEYHVEVKIGFEYEG